MTLISEFVSAIISLVWMSFCLFKRACSFGFETMFIVVNSWVELVRASLNFQVNLFQRIVMWVLVIVTLPARVLTCLQRYRQLELHLQEMQIEMENLLWDRKELERHFQIAIKEHKMMELMLEELEEEHGKAITKINRFERELRDLQNENVRLKEIDGKGYWSFRSQEDTSELQKLAIIDEYSIPYNVQSSKSGYNESGIMFQDLLMHKDAWEADTTAKAELLQIIKSGKASSQIIPKNQDMYEVLDEQRVFALSQSGFSAVLSLVVGVVVWEAEDPCMPLVVALFTVVGMSLKSVVQFFSTIKNKPASDAVALLSFNWFVLGMLTYPTLPIIARMLAPLTMRFMERVVSWFDLSVT